MFYSKLHFQTIVLRIEYTTECKMSFWLQWSMQHKPFMYVSTKFLTSGPFFLVFIFKFKVLRSFRISNQIKKEINFIFSIPETLKKCHQRIEWLLFFNAAFIHKCFHHSCLSGMAARFIDGGSLVLCKSHRISALKGPRLP